MLFVTPKMTIWGQRRALHSDAREDKIKKTEAVETGGSAKHDPGVLIKQTAMPAGIKLEIAALTMFTYNDSLF